ncbi:diguanylate cyclase domain-containing protein (plasmid) [Bradyrhizobium lupini]|uniref:diguanylate cyclase domain-containing protein n=1 Tax=Rhizobium lupini TaxID=136996 RepID=UPI00366F530A
MAALATSDALSGLANGLYFDERLADEWARAKRYASPLSLLLIDVDHYTKVNDQCGHQAGDACLRSAAQVRRPAIWPFGSGEEFALLLPSADADGCAETVLPEIIDDGDRLFICALWGRVSVAMLALSVLLASPCRSESARVRINIAGVGTERCDAMETGRANRDDVTKWIEGFWSGLNYVAAASGQKQSIVDPSLMLAKVEKACHRRPSQILATAAWSAFLALNQR